MFRALASDNFEPFGRLRLNLPSVENKPIDLAEVHLFTGINGTGKSRLLSVLAAALGNSAPIFSKIKDSLEPVLFHTSEDAFSNEVMTDFEPASLSFNEFDNNPLWESFEIDKSDVTWDTRGALFKWSKSVAAFAYNGSTYVKDEGISILSTVDKPSRIKCLSFTRQDNQSQELLQAISNIKIQAAIDSIDQKSRSKKISSAAILIDTIEDTISKITGFDFLFLTNSYPLPQIKVEWGGKGLSFDQLPDGLRSIIGWLVHAVVMTDLWSEGKGNPLKCECVFLLDEIESHLHPAWQRKILPAFQKLFPKAQIFIATHSPFVISSLNYGWIHSIEMESDGKASIKNPIAASPGDSYITVLEDIMGVKELYDPETEILLKKFRELRDKAYGGDIESRVKVVELSKDIASRGFELEYMMGQEIRQMERQLSKK